MGLAGCSGGATHLVFTSPPQTIKTGACSARVTGELRGPFGAEGAATDRLIVIEAPAGVTYSRDPQCSVRIYSFHLGPRTIPFSFFLRGDTPVDGELKVSSPGPDGLEPLGPVSQSLRIED